MNTFQTPTMAIPSGDWMTHAEHKNLLPTAYTTWEAEDYIRHALTVSSNSCIEAQGTVSQIPHSNQCYAHIVNVQANENLYNKGIVEGWVGFQFALGGESISVVDGHGQINFGGSRLTISSCTQPTRITKCYLAHSNFTHVDIAVHPEFLVEHLGVEPEKLPHTIQAILTGHKGDYFSRSMPLTPSMMRAVEAVIKPNFDGKLQETFAKVKTLELLCLAIEALITPIKFTQVGATLTDRDINLLYQARDIIAAQFASPPTLAELSRHVGMNRNKLSQGFKAMFGSGVYEYCQYLRMQQAKTLLQKNKHSLLQVAELIGFQNQSSFTRAYKNFYGHTPSLENQS